MNKDYFIEKWSEANKNIEMLRDLDLVIAYEIIKSNINSIRYCRCNKTTEVHQLNGKFICSECNKEIMKL
jgi:hypothetical protein